MGRVHRITAVVAVLAAVAVGAFFAGRATAPPSTAPTTTTTSAPTTTTAPGICQTPQLRISQSGTSGAAGTIERTFSLTNTASTTCTLYGYPGMLLLGPGATPEPTTVVRGGGLSFENVGPSLIELAPGETAFFNVGYSDVAPPCSTATAVAVTPPTNRAYAVVAVSPTVTACDDGTLHVSAVFGSTDAASTETTAPS